MEPPVRRSVAVLPSDVVVLEVVVPRVLTTHYATLVPHASEASVVQQQASLPVEGTVYHAANVSCAVGKGIGGSLVGEATIDEFTFVFGVGVFHREDVGGRRMVVGEG